jgi:Response regulator with putative antiterminator output domain
MPKCPVEMGPVQRTNGAALLNRAFSLVCHGKMRDFHLIPLLQHGSALKMATPLSIVICEKDPERAVMIRDALRETGDHDIIILAEEAGLAGRIAERNPDLVLIEVENPSRDVLEELTLASGPLERPVAIFVDRSDTDLTRAAIRAGVSAYVVDGLRSDRIRPVIDAAIARFNVFRQMREELAATRAALEERKVIDRAKGMLMRAKGLSEDEAYALLRRTAMDQKRRIAEVAQALVLAAEMLR